jgi:hypothetical protein
MSMLGACWRGPILGRIKEVLKELKQRRKIGSASELEEKQLQCGQTVVEQLESGQAPTRRNGWIEDQSRLSQGESGKT